MSRISRTNNFDLIRILAALQVVYSHGLRHIKPDIAFLDTAYYSFIRYFQGVPIFFCVSGFLIYWSFSRNSNDLPQFFWNRALRLFPALWCCLLVTIILLALDWPSLANLMENIPQLAAWVIGQMTLGQFYTPEALRFWGEHTPNGSLWTITVEAQFYLTVPVIFWLMKKASISRLMAVLIITLSILVNFHGDRLDHDGMTSKLLAVSVAPYLYYFMFGVLSYNFWDVIAKFVIDKFWYWLIFYIGFVIVVGNYLEYDISNYWVQSPLNIISDLIVCGLTLSFAFSYNSLSERILKGNDISYGVYIYHMLVINWLVHHGFQGSWISFAVTFVITILLGLLSWHLIEKKVLKYKKYRFWESRPTNTI